MNKKVFFYVCCGLPVAAGLGYTAGRVQGSKVIDTGEISPIDSPRAFTSTDSKKNILAEDFSSSSMSERQKASLDSLLRRYDKFTPKQIEAELKKLKGINVYELSGHYESPDIRTFTTIFYLSYKWGRQAPEQALSYMKTMGNMKDFCSLMVMQGWVESDITAAASYLAENRKSLGRERNMLHVIACSYGKNSPTEAITWISTLDEKDRKTAYPALISAIAEAHPAELKAIAARMTQEEAQESNIYRELALEWAARDWDYTKECIALLPKEKQAYATGDALGKLAQSDPKKAGKEFKKLDSGVQFIANLCILPAISEDSPIKAVNWLIKNASEDHLNKLATVALGNTAQSQSEELFIHIEKLPEGAAKQRFLSGIVDKTIQNTLMIQSRDYPIDYERNLSLASQIKDDNNRNDSTQSLLNLWIVSNPSEADQWLDKSTLPAEVKKEMKERCAQLLQNKGRMPDQWSAAGIRSMPPFSRIIQG